LSWYEGAVYPGMEVYSSGYPLEKGYVLEKGVITNQEARGEYSLLSLPYKLDHSAKVEPGNSGGPLLTKYGEVAGINHALLSEGDVYFSIPAKLAIPILADIQKGVTESIGIFGQAVPASAIWDRYPEGLLPADTYDTGLWIEAVTPGSEADRFGLEPGDIIIKVENNPVGNWDTEAVYCHIMKAYEQNPQLAITIYRYPIDEYFSGTFHKTVLAQTDFVAKRTNFEEYNALRKADYYTDFDHDISLDGWYFQASQPPDPADTDPIVAQKGGTLNVDLSEAVLKVQILNNRILGWNLHLQTTISPFFDRSVVTSLLCRKTGSNWYQFDVSADKHYAIRKFTDNIEEATLVEGYSENIYSSEKSNTIRATCNGDKLDLYVNDNENAIAAASDVEYTEGQSGIEVSSARAAHVVIEDFLMKFK